MCIKDLFQSEITFILLVCIHEMNIFGCCIMTFGSSLEKHLIHSFGLCLAVFTQEHVLYGRPLIRQDLDITDTLICHQELIFFQFQFSSRYSVEVTKEKSGNSVNVLEI